MRRRQFVLPATGALMGQAEDSTATARRVFAAGNLERAKRRLPALAWDDGLAAEASRHSQRMAALGFFGHRDPQRGNLEDRLRAAGIAYAACGENLYVHEGRGDTASGAVRSRMRSRGHRSNALSRRLTRTGIGVAANARGRRVVTQILAGGK